MKGMYKHFIEIHNILSNLKSAVWPKSKKDQNVMIKTTKIKILEPIVYSVIG